MKRREFLGVIGNAAAWPLSAYAQQPRKLPTIGFLGGATPSAWSHWVAAFAQRLRELGWIDGQSIGVEYRWAEGRSERYAEIAAEFVRLKVDVIVTSGAAVPAVRRVTSAIPIVFGVSGDAVREGLVASLARPGGNATGLSLLAPDITSKRLDILREVVPGLRRLGLIANVGHLGAAAEMGAAQAAAAKLGFEVVTHEIRRAEEIVTGFALFKSRTDALYVCTEPLMHGNRVRINILAAAAGLPTMYSNRDYVDSGGLMSYGPNSTALFRRAADYVDKILRGTKPAELPVEQPTKFDLVINLTTAKALGVTVPSTLLARADEVIE